MKQSTKTKATIIYIVEDILKISLIEISIECKKYWCNWCWWKWGINFGGLMKALPYFNEWKWKRLLQDLTYLCNWHDIQFWKWWSYFDFVRANFLFSYWVFKLIHWTRLFYRIVIFIVLFLWLTFKWKKYFNFITNNENE